jgi:WD40 repeat protein
VTALGVSADGKRVLFDQGKELALLSLAERGTVGVIKNAASGLDFTTLALVLPDGKLVLTAGAPEGALQLWRAPSATRPAAELRQLVRPDALPTCGAFAPDGSFVATGTRNREVLVWWMPSPEEVEQRLTARITLVEPFLDAHAGQARLWAEMKNPGYLLPGNTATMGVAPNE